MRKPVDYILKCSNNKFGTRMKDCKLGSYCLSKSDNIIYIHIYYQNIEVLKFECYKNPYFIAKAILDNSVESNIELIKTYLNKGLVPGLDFTIADKGIKLRKAK